VVARSLIATSASILGCGLAVCAHAAPVSAASPTPRWLAPAERQTLDRVFGGAQPVHTHLIPYAKKICGRLGLRPRRHLRSVQCTE